jgi:hypothetical protein
VWLVICTYFAARYTIGSILSGLSWACSMFPLACYVVEHGNIAVLEESLTDLWHAWMRNSNHFNDDWQRMYYVKREAYLFARDTAYIHPWLRQAVAEDPGFWVFVALPICMLTTILLVIDFACRGKNSLLLRPFFWTRRLFTRLFLAICQFFVAKPTQPVVKKPVQCQRIGGQRIGGRRRGSRTLAFDPDLIEVPTKLLKLRLLPTPRDDPMLKEILFGHSMRVQ